tara:strand:- start:22 stop:180 length:159 start_codon:yes stop_codon:yes gene_type:complete
MKIALILLVNEEKSLRSSVKYPPKLPVIKRISIGIELNPKEYAAEVKKPILR